MKEKLYPIISIYPTIQGQGPRMGEPMILVRTSTPPEFTEFCYLKPTRKVKFKSMSSEEIVSKCLELQAQYPGIKWVFWGGDDPCISEFNFVADALHGEEFKIWLDTTGIFIFDHKKVDHLSIGPKPKLPFLPELIKYAHDVRLYWRSQDKEIWEENYERVLPYVKSQIFIAPRVLTQECVDSVIQFVLTKAGQKPPVRADIPLFRTLPNFDANFNKGQKCPMCHLMDKFQGVEVKSCL